MAAEQRPAYKFTNKETGEVKYGILHTAGEGFDIFRALNTEDIRVENKEMNGTNLISEKYTVEPAFDYLGQLPTWKAE